MPEYAWTYLNKQDSEYTSGSEYVQILNVAGFSICKHYVVNMPEYAFREFWIYLGF